jgi:hypothetical protein
MKKLAKVVALSAAAVAIAGAAHAADGKRMTVTGEVIDTWCYLTEIMYAEGTAHHRCAVWCAAGGIPVGIKGDDGKVYMVLKMESDTTNVVNPALLTIQTHKVTVNGDHYRRDGIDYLLVSKVVEDAGIVNQTHQKHGIQP